MKIDTNPGPKVKWFDDKVLVGHLNVDVFGHVVAYATVVLLIEEKYELFIGLSRDFANITQHNYSEFILDFTLAGQEKLHAGAMALRKSK